MTQTFYFYDLETTGVNAREARIMQFAGQRTDMELKPIGEPHNIFIKITEDVIPEPEAILITGITPQKTLQEGITEAEFLQIFTDEVATPGTIFVGFNTVRFDDEFMRFLHYRNYYDAYEWQWKDDRSRWDLLDLARMTRALRPDGIKWPFDSNGKPSNRLELLTSLNGLAHENAHDALSDVHASIDVARLIKTNQPKLFDYLLEMRHKKSVEELTMSGRPFVYTSGKYASEHEKTTVVATICQHPSQSGGALVFDLRFDPTPFSKMEVGELVEIWRKRYDEPGIRLPVKTLKYNRCPAVADLRVFDSASQERLGLSEKTYKENFEKLKKVQDTFCEKIKLAVEQLDMKQQARLLEDELDVDARLYENFFSSEDKHQMSQLRSAGIDELRDYSADFKDQRLQLLLPLYKARNFPAALSDDDRLAWETFRRRKLLGGGMSSRLAKFFGKLAELSERKDLNADKRYLLEELQLYGQSIMPEQD